MTTGSSSRIFRCSFFNSYRILLAGLCLGHRIFVLAQLSLLAICYSTWAASDPTAVIESLTGSGRGGEVIERGKDFAIVRTIAATTNVGGSIQSVTNHVTLLENGLHYFAEGEWRISRDVIEPFPGGAIARHGPNKTIFSSELLDEAVFDIETAEGHRIRGGVRAIQLMDVKTGRIAVLGTVRNGVRGEIIPPNQVVYRSGFDGIKADVLLVWRHDSLSQNVILLEKPILPEGMDPATTRLEVVSELVESPQPVLASRTREDGLRDDVTIGLGSMFAVRGKAFPVTDSKALVLTGSQLADDGGVNVAKELFQLEDGRRFVIESVGWDEIQPLLRGLKTAALNDPPARRDLQMANSRVWPKSISPTETQESLQIAALPYQSTGFLVDIDLSGSASTYTFLSGVTYYIAQSFYINGSATTAFQPGCVVKYGNDAWLVLHCPISTPPTGQLMPVLTSKDDDTFGAMIPGSTHSPTYMASRALWVYFVIESQTEIKNMRIRWAKKGIQYDASPGNEVEHTVRDCLFQNCQTGIQSEAPDAFFSLINVKKCNVSKAFNGISGGVSGEMVADCGPFYTVASFSGISQAESLNSIPDTIGAVGPSHFMSILNGSYSVAVFDKYTGERRSPANTTTKEFFTVTVPSGPYAGTYPSADPVDPQILYDFASQRWIACAFSVVSPRHVILAVSNGSDPVGNGGATWVSDNWTKYLVPFGSSCGTDRPKLGLDSNGIYISVSCASHFMKIAALPKAPFMEGTAGPVQSNFFLDGPQVINGHIWPALNYEPIAATDSAWFLYTDFNQNIRYNHLKWVNGFSSPPIWQNSLWGVLTITPSYYDLGNDGIRPPQLTGPGRVSLYQVGSMLLMALSKTINGTQHLWTCHQIGVDANGNNNANQADRSAIAWYKIQTSPSVLIVASGRIYDQTPSNPTHYYLPSLAVNKNGDFLVGFSGSSSSQYVGAYYTGSLVNGTMPNSPICFFPGKDWFDTPSGIMRWGDFSGTVVDTDGLTFWTIQEYAETRFGPPGGHNAWGTRIGAVSP